MDDGNGPRRTGVEKMLEFQSTLFRTTANLTDAVAEAWMTANGQNSAADVTKFLTGATDEALADECIAGWGFDRPADDFDPTSPTWLEARGIDRADIVQAFRRFRADRPDLAADAE